MVGGCFSMLNWCRGGKSGSAQPQSSEEGLITNNVRVFSYSSLRSATGNFHPSSRIGGGGYGTVYRGVLGDGTQIAIKSLSAESTQGTQEFFNEVHTVSKIRHPNLVELIGCCIEDTHRILVYEYLENNSLSSNLFGSKRKHLTLHWSTRASICLGAAYGLRFLHEEADPQIVHRDIKASNILLDATFHPKIGDFGLAKLFPDNVTHISTRVAGTIGYLAPEYASFGQLTKKADIYSFGVLMLEIISGSSCSKVAFGEDLLVLVEWAWKLGEEERLLELVDRDLTEYPEAEVMRFIKVALFCTQAAASQRPSMKQVVEMLSKDVRLNEKILTKPGVYKKAQISRRLGGGVSTEEASSSNTQKSKQSSFQFNSCSTQTQLDPR